MEGCNINMRGNSGIGSSGFNNRKRGRNFSEMRENVNYCRKSGRGNVTVPSVNIQLRKVFDTGIRLRMQGKYQKAINLFSLLIKIAPNNITGYNSRGFTFMIQKNYTNALLDFNKCLELDPDSICVLLNRGKCLVDMEELDLALADYERAVRLFPRDPRAHYGVSLVRRKQRIYGDSLCAIRKAIQFERDEWKLRKLNEFLDGIVGDLKQQIFTPNQFPMRWEG